jgi:hypothetical protein
VADDRPQYQSGVGTIGGQSFHWGSGQPGAYWSIPYGDYPVTPDAPTGAWAHQVGAIPIANNVIPDPLLHRDRIGIMIHSGSSNSLDQLYTQGCFKVAPSEWPAVRSEILKEAANGPLYLHVAPGGVAAFTNTKTFSQAGDETPAANANAAANTTAAAPGGPQGTTINSTGLARPATPTPSPTPMFAGLNPDARGMKNNNPGNLIDNAWTQSLPGYKGSDGKFAIFDTPQHGAIALDTNLAHYGTKGIDTPLGIASTWAPASDNNNPNSYGGQIAKSLGVGLNDKININDPAIRSKVGQAIGLVENGPGKSTGFTVGVGAPTASTSTPPPAPGPIDPSIIARGGYSPPIPTTPGTTINSNPMASLGGKIGDLATNLQKDLGKSDEAQKPPDIKPDIPPTPGARNVSPLLGNPQIYAQRMAGLSQPLAWNATPMGQGQMPGAGYGPQNQPVFGTSLMSQLQMLSDPTWMNQMAGG